MPELPDVTLYREGLEARVVGQPLEEARIASPFVLRSFDPPLAAATGLVVRKVRRIGKRLVLGFDGELFLVFHLMIAGRLRWRATGEKPGVAAKNNLATFRFPNGTLHFSEASTKKRASLTLVRGEAALAALDPGGIEPLTATLEEFRAALTRENHTVKRALTDPRLFSGIGNAYSDEILHAAKLSPMKLTKSMSEDEIERLHKAVRSTLVSWTEILRRENGGRFPETVTAFPKGMAVHGRFEEPCPACGSPVQRIRYASNETNYCAKCQTGGRLLADRAMSRLLKQDWPRTLEELEG